MADHTIQLPSKPQAIKEEGQSGLYQIDGLYPGYGHTLGNSLRRIILSSLPGAAITGVKIDGIRHEFDTIEGVREDVIKILLNLKKVRIKLNTEEEQTLTIKIKGPKEVTARDIELPGQVEVLNPDEHIASVTGKIEFNVELRAEKGLGYVPKETIQKERVNVGEIALDAIFTPVRRVNYEVENMRVGDRTDFNRLKMLIETDGTIEPREVLEDSIAIMITQLKAIVGFKEDDDEILEEMKEETGEAEADSPDIVEEQEEERQEFLKTRIESLGLSTRTENALDIAGIRTVGGLVRKKEEDILNIEGLGDKGLQEIKRVLGNHGIILTDEL